MKKIAFIVQDLTGGGAERTVSNLSFSLSGLYDFYIIVFNGEQVSYKFKGTLIDVKLPPRKSKIGKLINIIKRTIALRKIKNKYQFDVTIGFQFSASIVNCFSKRKGEIIVTSARNFMSAYGLTFSNCFRERYIAKHSNHVVAISDMVKWDLINNFKVNDRKITTIYNPCDASRVSRLACEEIKYQFVDDCFYFVSVGRLVRQKGQWDLLKSFSIVLSKYSNVKLLILGSGENEVKLKKLSEDLSISKNVEFLGFQDNPFAYVKKSDVFVFTSLHEGLGNVILESMACGTPVISTDCYAGPREILAPHSIFNNKAQTIEYEEFGVIVPEISNNEDYSTNINNNHLLLADAMIRMMKDNDMRSGYIQKGYRRLSDFDPEIIANSWMSFFNGVLTKNE